MTVNHPSLGCVGERKKVFLPDITRVQGLNSQAGGQAKESLNRDISFRGSIILRTKAGRATPSVSITCCLNVTNSYQKIKTLWRLSSKCVFSGSHPTAFGSSPQLQIVCWVHRCQITSSSFQNVSFSGAKKNSAVLQLDDAAFGFMNLRVWSFSTDRGLCNRATGVKTWKSAKLELHGFHMTTVPHGIV